MDKVKESVVQSKLISELKQIPNCLYQKVTQTVYSEKGWPDIIIYYICPIFKRPEVMLCECKKQKGGKISAHQMRKLAQLRKLMFDVRIIKSVEDIGVVIKRITEG